MKKLKIKVNGINHQVYSWGNPKKPLLFFLHGWLDTGASFHFLAETLGDHFYCVAPDLRGFGRSQHGKNPLGYFFYEYQADVHALLNKLSPKKPVLAVGHSMGGNILSIYAGAFPDRIAKLINMEGFGITDQPSEMGPKRLKGWVEEDVSKLRFRTYKNTAALARRLVAANPNLPMDRALFLAGHLAKKKGKGVIVAADPQHKRFGPYLFQWNNFEAFLRKITAKCLLVLAENTEMARWLKSKEDVEKEIARRLACYPKGSEIITIPGRGHMVHHEKPGQVAEKILTFFKS